MTREEQTISNLKKLKSFHNGSYGTDIDRAIKALEQEPCPDAISRQAVLDCLTATKLKKFDFILNARAEIKKLPSINTQPKTGYWFAWKPEDDVWRTTCSECGEETRTLWNYCPNCGARMIEPQEGEIKK